MANGLNRMDDVLSTSSDEGLPYKLECLNLQRVCHNCLQQLSEFGFKIRPPAA